MWISSFLGQYSAGDSFSSLKFYMEDYHKAFDTVVHNIDL